MLLALLVLQAAAAAPPDIELDARVTANRVEIRESRGVSLTVRAQPDAGSQVRTENPNRGGRGRVLRNVDVRVRAEARLAIDPAARASPASPASPQR